MTYDRAELFAIAWYNAKADLWRDRAPARELRAYFRAALVRAWVEVKRRAVYRAEKAAQAQRPVAELRAEVSRWKTPRVLAGKASIACRTCAAHCSKPKNAKPQNAKRPTLPPSAR
ncbi:MAG: hypothetical protein R3D84_15500 [Paracoccaceae bacterium]